MNRSSADLAADPDAAFPDSEPDTRHRLRFELLFAAGWLALGLFALPALIYGIGTLLLGPYGEGAGLGDFYADFYGDLATPSGRAWAIALGPLLLISLLRAVFLGISPRADADDAAPRPAAGARRGSPAPQGRATPTLTNPAQANAGRGRPPQADPGRPLPGQAVTGANPGVIHRGATQRVTPGLAEPPAAAPAASGKTSGPASPASAGPAAASGASRAAPSPHQGRSKRIEPHIGSD